LSSTDNNDASSTDHNAAATISLTTTAAVAEAVPNVEENKAARDADEIVTINTITRQLTVSSILLLPMQLQI